MEPGLQMLLENIRDDVKELRSDVKELQGFRWQTAGIATACGFIVAIIMQIYFH